MNQSSIVFSNYDIEIAKKRIKCDSILFLVCFFIPISLVLLIWNGELASYFIFWFTLIFSPYALTATFGFFTSQNETSYANCYFSMLKCTFIYCTMSIGISALATLFILYSILTLHCDSSKSDTCGLSRAVGIIFFIIAVLYFILSVFAFTLWWFSNKHANSLKDLLLRKAQNFNNPIFGNNYVPHAQFVPIPGVSIGYLQRQVQYNPISY